MIRITPSNNTLQLLRRESKLVVAFSASDAREAAEAARNCNKPLCVTVDEAHVIHSTQTANLRYAVSCGRAGAAR